MTTITEILAEEDLKKIAAFLSVNQEVLKQYSLEKAKKPA